MDGKNIIWKFVPAKNTCSGLDRWTGKTEDGFHAVYALNEKRGQWDIKFWGPDKVEFYGHVATEKAARRAVVALIAAIRST